MLILLYGLLASKENTSEMLQAMNNATHYIVPALGVSNRNCVITNTPCWYYTTNKNETLHYREVSDNTKDDGTLFGIDYLFGGNVMYNLVSQSCTLINSEVSKLNASDATLKLRTFNKVRGNTNASNTNIAVTDYNFRMCYLHSSVYDMLNTDMNGVPLSKTVFINTVPVFVSYEYAFTSSDLYTDKGIRASAPYSLSYANYHYLPTKFNIVDNSYATSPDIGTVKYDTIKYAKDFITSDTYRLNTCNIMHGFEVTLALISSDKVLDTQTLNNLTSSIYDGLKAKSWSNFTTNVKDDDRTYL